MHSIQPEYKPDIVILYRQKNIIKLSLLFLITFRLLFACSESEPTDIEVVSTTYGLSMVDGVELPIDSVSSLGTTGSLQFGEIRLYSEGLWKLELDFFVGNLSVVASDSGTFSVFRIKANEPCSQYPCQIDFQSSSRTFSGSHAGGGLTIELDSLVMEFEDVRI